MGWVVYDDQYRMVKYYKKPGPAKAAVTRYRNEMTQGYRGDLDGPTRGRSKDVAFLQH